MTERNAEYADARVKVDNVVRAREDMIGSLVASYHAYEDLLTKTTKGLEFYDKLEANVSKLLARVGGVVKVQEDKGTAQLNSSAMKVDVVEERAEEEEEGYVDENVEEEELFVEEEVDEEEDSEEEEFVAAGKGKVQVLKFVFTHIRILINECQ